MDKRSALYIFFVGLFLIICLAAFSQKTAIYTNPDAGFKSGLELFQKQKYGSAQKQFNNIIKQYKDDENNLVRIDAEYYAALCALELFNKDAELLLKQFIADHPESPRVQTAAFYLGKYNYRKKQYLKALEWFAKVDLYDLNNEELSEFYFKRGYSLFETDSVQSAKKDFFEIKDIDNKYAAPATYYFGHISYLEKNYQTALQHFNKLKGNKDFGPIVPYYIVQIFYLQQKYDSAIAIATPLLDSTSKRVTELTKIIGESYFRTNRYKEALPFLEKYKGLTATLNRSEWYQLGYAYYKTDNTTSALYCFQQATDGKDTLAQNAYYHLADCYLRPSPYSGGNASKMLARNAFEMAYKLDFDKTVTEDALFNYAKLSYELAFSPFNEAVTALNDYITRYPTSPRLDECYKYLVNVYLSTRNYRQAMASIESMKTMGEDMKMAYQKIAFMRGLQLFNDEKFQDAIMYLNKSLIFPINRNYVSLAYFWKGEANYRIAEIPADLAGLDSSIAGYKAFLAYPGAINFNEYFAAHYGMGYAYFKKAGKAKDDKEKQPLYSESNVWFRKYVTLKGSEPANKMHDAYLRIGDNFFMTHDFAGAADYYDQALTSGKSDADYAMYQKGLALGLTKKLPEKTKVLSEMLAMSGGKSTYEAAAKYELAGTYYDLKEYDNALLYYKKVITQHDTSSFTGRALQKTGLIQLNNKQDYVKAAEAFNTVIKKYPKTDVAKEAVEGLTTVYTITKQPERIDSLAHLSWTNISATKLDSTNYKMAYDFYEKKDCNNASLYFNKYIQKYPDGLYIVDAMFYKAECDFDSKNYDLALGGYQYVVDRKFNTYTETALLKGSYVNYRNKNYRNALRMYSQLAEVAEHPMSINEARIGEMRCQWLLGNYDGSVEAAQKVLTLDKISEEIQAEAHMIIAKSALEKQNLDQAATAFSTIVKLVNNEKSAEARYNLAYILYLKGQYKESQKTAFDLLNQDPGYEYWMGKAWILLSDTYLALGDKFNAKYALTSFLDKSTDAELLAVAKEKLTRIQDMEKIEEEKKQQKKAEELNIQFRPDNPKDSTLFKQE